MATRLPALIPSSSAEPGKIVRLFGQKAHGEEQPAQENKEPTWRGKYDMVPPHVSKQRRVNGFQNRPGDSPQNFRTLAFENPSKPGEFSVALLMETWPFGQQLTGTPSIRLWLHSRHDSMDKAATLADSLALNNVFGNFKKMIEEAGDNMTVLSSDAFDVPFATPAHWTARPAVSAYIPKVK